MNIDNIHLDDFTIEFLIVNLTSFNLSFLMLTNRLPNWHLDFYVCMNCLKYQDLVGPNHRVNHSIELFH